MAGDKRNGDGDGDGKERRILRMREVRHARSVCGSVRRRMGIFESMNEGIACDVDHTDGERPWRCRLAWPSDHPQRISEAPFELVCTWEYRRYV